MAQKPVGKASIKVEVDGLEEAKRGLDDMKTKTEDVGKAGRSGFGKLDESVGKVGKRIEDSTEGLRRFQGAITGIIGVVGGLVAIAVGGFKKIAGEIKQAKDAADAFGNSLKLVRSSGEDAVDAVNGFGNTADAMGQLTALVSEQRRVIAEATAQAIADAKKKYEEANPFNPLAEKKLRKQLEEDLAEIQANERRQLQRLNEAAARKEAETEARIAEEKAAEIGRIQDEEEKKIADRTRALRLATLDDVARAEEELAFKQKQIQNEIAFADDSRRVDQLKEILRLETQVGQAKVQAAKDAAAAEAKREEDRASQELAKALRELAKASEDQARSQNDLIKRMDQLNRQVSNFAPAITKIGDGIRY